MKKVTALLTLLTIALAVSTASAWDMRWMNAPAAPLPDYTVLASESAQYLIPCWPELTGTFLGTVTVLLALIKRKRRTLCVAVFCGLAVLTGLISMADAAVPTGFKKYYITNSFIYRYPGEETGYVAPTGIASDGEYLYVNDTGLENGGLWKLATNGSVVSTHSMIFTGGGMTCDGTYLLLPDGEEMELYTKTGDYVFSFDPPGVGAIGGIAWGDGVLYALSQDSIYTLSGASVVSQFVSPTSLGAIAFDGEYIIGASPLGKVISTMDTDGNLIGSQHLPLPFGIVDLCFAGNDKLYVIDCGEYTENQERIYELSLVPEPSTTIMVLSGLFLGFRCLKRH